VDRNVDREFDVPVAPTDPALEVSVDCDSQISSAHVNENGAESSSSCSDVASNAISRVFNLSATNMLTIQLQSRTRTPRRP